MDPSEHFAQVLVQSRRNPDLVADLQKMLNEDTYRHRHFAYNHRTLFESFISFNDGSHGVLAGDYYPQPREYSIVFTQTSGKPAARLEAATTDPETFRRLERFQSKAELIYRSNAVSEASVVAVALAIMRRQVMPTDNTAPPDLIDQAAEMLLDDQEMLRTARAVVVHREQDGRRDENMWNEAHDLAVRMLAGEFPGPQAQLQKAASAAVPTT